MPKYLLGTDNGGTVSKAGLFATDGREIAVVGRKTEMLSPRPGHTERDPEQIWRATAESIRAVIDTSGVDPRDIEGVACAGHGNGIYLVDGHGQPVCPGIYSTDSRAKDYVARWSEEGIDQKVRPKTMQCIWPAQPNALLAWLRDHEPEVISRARWVLMCKDYIRFRLTGEVYAEMTDFSGTSLMDVGTGRYDPEVLEAFGIAEMRRLLPPLRRSEEICGRVTSEAAAETGLAEGTPVAGGLFDIDACGLASALTDPSQMCMIAGTWGINQYIWQEPVVSEDVFMTSRYCIPGYYLIMEGSATSASNLEWFVTQFFPAGRHTGEQADASVYDRCNQWVAATRPDEAQAVFLPFLFGSNAALEAKASLVGLSGWHHRGHALRAIYEGVVFAHKTHVNKLLKFRGPPQSIHLTGGVARSEVWVQIFADVFQVPVEIPAGTELGALGAAICAGVAVGCYPSFAEACKAMVKIDRVQRPDPAYRDVYAAKFERYQRVVAALSPVCKDFA
ncbi:MAG: carbohydrate kinase [Pirellulales bacterium]|nr:carbohydrate kinase [Pirellulales bacterium]